MGLKDPKDNPCWRGYHPVGTKNKNGKEVPNCVPVNEEVDEYDVDSLEEIADFVSFMRENFGQLNESQLEEAEYRGRKVKLGKPFLTPGGPKKRSVYVKNPKGNVVKVNFGDPNMRIKKSSPSHRKSFRARHNCSNPGPRHKARYWSCRAW